MAGKRNEFVLFCGVLIILALFAGCAAQKVADYETSGFLRDYSGFEVGAKEQVNLLYINPNGQLKTYNKILIDHVVVYFKRGSENKGIDPADLNELSRYFHNALVPALQDLYTIVNEPGPGVLRIRSAITDLEPRNAVSGTLSTVVPVGAAVSVIKKAGTNSNMAVGRASMEVELVDSLSGERMAAAIDKREGGKKAVSRKWADVEEAFDYWAQKLRLFLTRQQGV